MYVESFHRILKYVYMKGRRNRRIDNLIHVLMNISRDKGFERLCKLEKGKISGRLATIHKRHIASMKLSPTLVATSNHKEWTVKSSDGTQTYTVTKENEQCPFNCHLYCKECAVCIHICSCTCLDA